MNLNTYFFIKIIDDIWMNLYIIDSILYLIIWIHRLTPIAIHNCHANAVLAACVTSCCLLERWPFLALTSPWRRSTATRRSRVRCLLKTCSCDISLFNHLLMAAINNLIMLCCIIASISLFPPVTVCYRTVFLLLLLI